MGGPPPLALNRDFRPRRDSERLGRDAVVVRPDDDGDIAGGALEEWRRARAPASTGPRAHAGPWAWPSACARLRRRRARWSDSGGGQRSWPFAFFIKAGAKRRSAATNRPRIDHARNIVLGERGFHPRREGRRRHFVSETKCVSLRRKKRYTTETPRTERAGLATRFSPPKGLIFHSGWERRRVRPLVRGSVSAANE